jgi:hypothetical protein
LRRAARPQGKARLKQRSRAKNSEITITGRRKGKPAQEREHFYICPDCGQIVDKRDLGEYYITRSWHTGGYRTTPNGRQKNTAAAPGKAAAVGSSLSAHRGKGEG